MHQDVPSLKAAACHHCTAVYVAASLQLCRYIISQSSELRDASVHPVLLLLLLLLLL